MAAHEGLGSSHEGVEKTVLKISNYAYWPGMKKDVKLYIAACPVCDKFRNMPRGARSHLGTIPSGNRGDLLAVDVLGGQGAFPISIMGNKCILVMIDVSTKYLVAVALPDQLARRVVDTLLHRWILFLASRVECSRIRGLTLNLQFSPIYL